MRYSVELDGLSDKYVKLKEQNQVISRSLEETRDELRQREDEAFEAERRVTELENELTGSREKAGDATEQLSGLKVRLTQKDRQIEELQRQLDLLEYELRSQRDEMESLQSNFNREGGDVDRLERKVNLLQEVIEEKESLIEQLRMDLRDKDIEIRQVRMGVGISDLEHEKRQLLEDYHNATRRVDELNDRLQKQTKEVESLRGEVVEVREAADRKPAQLEDVSDHPDFKAKAREVERLREDLAVTQKDLAKAELKFEAAQSGSEGVARLEADVVILQRKNDSLETKLAQTETQIRELREVEARPAKAGPVLDPGFIEELEALVDAAAAARSNARLIRRYASQIEKMETTDAEAGEAIDLLNDIAVVLYQDLNEQERMARELHGQVGALGGGEDE